MGKNDSNEHWIRFLGSLNEVQARQLAGLKALEFGWGGISKVGKLTGMDYKTIKGELTNNNLPELYHFPMILRHRLTLVGSAHIPASPERA
jgi:hypothetical protein